MRLLAACSLGGAGHLNPLVPFLDHAAAAGHEVLVVAVADMAEMVERTGHRFAAGGAPTEEEIAPIREQLPVLPEHEAAVLGNRDLFGRLATRAMLPEMTRIFEDWRPDAVLRDPVEYASAVVAGRHGVPHRQVAISLAAVEWGSLDLATPVLEELDKGLPDRLRSAPYLSRFPAWVDPSPFPTTVRYRDPSPARGTSRPDPWPPGEGPRIYLTFGTVLGYMTYARSVYETAVGALADLPVRILLTVGRRFDQASLGRLPDNVRIQPWVDQADILGEADLVVCHGGSGTVLGALAAGVPIVVVPVFADQFANARWVSASGAAEVVEPVPAEVSDVRRIIGGDDRPRIAAAVQRVLGDPTYRNAAGKVAAEIAALPAVDRLIEDW
ncbi:MAG TPA: glycosyltransferase [Acidimicrobiales bacterium]|nr:glycosyltransferase [Acidimicrobiales bacterium]